MPDLISASQLIFGNPLVTRLRKIKVGKLVVCDDIRKIDYDACLAQINMKNVRYRCLSGGASLPCLFKVQILSHGEKIVHLRTRISFTLYEYFRALDEIRPKVFFFENVFGFVYKPHKAAFDLLKERAEEYGYDITYKVVNTADYGVPQTRERFICVGVRRDFGSKICVSGGDSL